MRLKKSKAVEELCLTMWRGGVKEDKNYLTRPVCVELFQTQGLFLEDKSVSISPNTEGCPEHESCVSCFPVGQNALVTPARSQVTLARNGQSAKVTDLGVTCLNSFRNSKLTKYFHQVAEA